VGLAALSTLGGMGGKLVLQADLTLFQLFQFLHESIGVNNFHWWKFYLLKFVEMLVIGNQESYPR
jgi:hypothetical protein